MDLKEVKEALDGINTAFTEFKQSNDTRIKEIETKGHADPLLDEKLKKINDAMDAFDVKMERAKTIDITGALEEKAAEEKRLKTIDDAYAGKGGFLRFGEKMDGERMKFLATDNDEQGGIWVPEQRRDTIIELLLEFNPIRDLAQIETISIGNQLMIPKEGGTADQFGGGWTAERESRPETATGTFAAEDVPVHEQYANPRATQTMIDDGAFDVGGWLNRKIAQKFARLEGQAFLNGDAIGKPEGLLTNPDIVKVPTGTMGAVTADGLIDTFYSLPDFYARNGSWIMRRATVGEIRKLKDMNDQYLWAPGFSGNLATTAPSTILGASYREAPDYPAIAADTDIATFGDFRAGYLIVDRQGIRVVRDPFTAKPFIEFYSTRRVGGQVVLAEAFRTNHADA